MANNKILIFLAIVIILLLGFIGFNLYRSDNNLSVTGDVVKENSNTELFNEFLDCIKKCPPGQSEDTDIREPVINDICFGKCEYDFSNKYGEEKLKMEVFRNIKDNPYENYNEYIKLDCLEECDLLYSCSQNCLK